MAELINISKTPNEIDFRNIEIKQGDCFINSYRVAIMFPDVLIVEGLIMVVYDNNKAQVFCHVWNKLGDVHFDCTREMVWIGSETFAETNEIKYFSVCYHKHTDYKDGSVFEFSKDTKINEEELNKRLNNK